jgi:hypothetical protein
MRLNPRLLAARLLLPLGLGRRELKRLFAGTAAAFRSPVPPRLSLSLGSRLRDYALFTCICAEEALGRPRELQALEGRLFGEALALGSGYRHRLRLRGIEEAMSAARLIYRCLGIDFHGSAGGELLIRRCAFAAVYTPRICALVSALDRGLMAGLTGGGLLEFSQRITEGADSCRAYLREGI